MLIGIKIGITDQTSLLEVLKISFYLKIPHTKSVTMSTTHNPNVLIPRGDEGINVINARIVYSTPNRVSTNFDNRDPNSVNKNIGNATNQNVDNSSD